MRYLEIRDLWLQKEVCDGKLVVEEIPGVENPADRMTKVLGVKGISSRLKSMSINRVDTAGVADERGNYFHSMQGSLTEYESNLDE
eukprot:2097529-Karenia_brevis.AAC.1